MRMSSSYLYTKGKRLEHCLNLPVERLFCSMHILFYVFSFTNSNIFFGLRLEIVLIMPRFYSVVDGKRSWMEFLTGDRRPDGLCQVCPALQVGALILALA